MPEREHYVVKDKWIIEYSDYSLSTAGPTH